MKSGVSSVDQRHVDERDVDERDVDERDVDERDVDERDVDGRDVDQGAGRPMRRPGGRTARVRRDVLAATIDLLAEAGLAGVTVESVAARSGVNKTTVYRRWPSLPGLVVDAVAEVARVAVPVPDTGSLRGDLRQVLGEVAALITSPRGRALVRATLSADNDEDLAALRRRYWAHRFALVGEVVRRAVDRGEIPPTTEERFVLETLTAPLYFRVFVVGGPLDGALLDRLVDHMLAGLGAGRD
jgi:AcrR family transcriptional regulator